MTSIPTAAHAAMSADSFYTFPTGLTETDVVRIAAAISAARGLSPLPARPLAVCAYLIDRAAPTGQPADRAAVQD